MVPHLIYYQLQRAVICGYTEDTKYGLHLYVTQAL